MIAVLVPSRGRPERARTMADSVHANADGEVLVVVIIDPDEPRLTDYTALFPTFDNRTRLAVLSERLGYTGSLNLIAATLWDEYDILGAFGDDVLFQTAGWDRMVTDALATPGIAYPRDGVHDKGHPTAVWMSSVIAQALGWLAMPYTRHLWADDAWKALGNAAGVLRFLPDVYCEHLHPAVKKAAMDATYESVYDGDLGHRDHLGFVGWREVDLERDAAKVRAVA